MSDTSAVFTQSATNQQQQQVSFQQHHQMQQMTTVVQQSQNHQITQQQHQQQQIPQMPQQQQQQQLANQQQQQPQPVVQSNIRKDAVIIELPKIDSNQQLFSLNTLTNHITQLSPGLTTAALAPMERLLIVPAGINAQQLAQCLIQGQIHFNNIGQATQATDPAKLQQQQQVQQQQGQQQQGQQQQSQHQPIQQQQVPQVQVQPQENTKIKVQHAVEPKPRKPKPRKPKAEVLKPTRPVIITQPQQQSHIVKNTIPEVKPQPQLINRTPQALIQLPDDKMNTPNSRPPSTSSMCSNASASSTHSSHQVNHFNHQQTMQPVTNGPTALSHQQNVQIVRPTIPQQVVAPSTRAVPMAQQNNNYNGAQQHVALNRLPAQLPQRSPQLTPTQQPMMAQQQPQTSQQVHPITTQANQHITMPSVQVAPVTVPPLVSVNPIQQQPTSQQQQQTSPQQSMPRVQTIQLTPQKQQLLKNVQMQIQSLSSRLQNKSLLSTLTIPPDFDLNNPVHNKPLPSLNNMNAMSDADIHQALQRLFIEQQKILATGKVIPTIPSGHSFNTPPPAVNQLPSAPLIVPTSASVVQSCNKSSTTPVRLNSPKPRPEIVVAPTTTSVQLVAPVPPMSITCNSVMPRLAPVIMTIQDDAKPTVPEDTSHQPAQIMHLHGPQQQLMKQPHHSPQMLSAIQQLQRPPVSSTQPIISVQLMPTQQVLQALPPPPTPQQALPPPQIQQQSQASSMSMPPQLPIPLPPQAQQRPVTPPQAQLPNEPQVQQPMSMQQMLMRPSHPPPRPASPKMKVPRHCL